MIRNSNKAYMEKLEFQKLHPKAVLPSRGSKNASGLDIHSIEEVTIKSGNRTAIHTGLAVEIPHGFYGRMAPRSGLALKIGIDVLAGVIDADYRGEIICLLINLGEHDFKINVGDRIAQLLIEKIAMLEPAWNQELNKTERDRSGFGSTGS